MYQTARWPMDAETPDLDKFRRNLGISDRRRLNRRGMFDAKLTASRRYESASLSPRAPPLRAALAAPGARAVIGHAIVLANHGA